MACRARPLCGGKKIVLLSVAVIAPITAPLVQMEPDGLSIGSPQLNAGQTALAADKNERAGVNPDSFDTMSDLLADTGNPNQTPPGMVPPEVMPGTDSSTRSPEIDEVKQRILSKLSQAEAKGVGTSAYRAALNGLLGNMPANNGAEQALNQLKSLEQNLDSQLKQAVVLTRDSIGSAVQFGNLTISASQPVMNTKFYDPANRPAGIPVPAEFEGFTTWTINPHVNVHWNDSSQLVATANVAMSCEIVTWLPAGASKKLVAHEGGHAKICLKLYERGHLVVREMAQKYLMNRPWRNGQANKEFQAAFQAEVKDLINWVNEDYDRITNHGRNSLDSDQAVAESFRRCSQGYKQYLKK